MVLYTLLFIVGSHVLILLVSLGSDTSLSKESQQIIIEVVLWIGHCISVYFVFSTLPNTELNVPYCCAFCL